MHRKVSGIIQYFFTIRPDSRILLLSGEISGRNLILLNCWFFSYTNILEISMHTHDIIIYLIHCCKITIFFSIGLFFFLEDFSKFGRTSDSKKLPSRISDRIPAICPDVRYPMSGNFTIPNTSLIFKYHRKIYTDCESYKSSVTK